MNNVSRKLQQITSELDPDKIASEGAIHLRSITPIRSGNARRHTYANGYEIRAEYAYAGRLDDNYSKQTNNQGLIEPTMEFLETLVNKAGQ